MQDTLYYSYTQRLQILKLANCFLWSKNKDGPWFEKFSETLRTL